MTVQGRSIIRVPANGTVTEREEIWSLALTAAWFLNLVSLLRRNISQQLRDDLSYVFIVV